MQHYVTDSLSINLMHAWHKSRNATTGSLKYKYSDTQSFEIGLKKERFNEIS